MNEEESNNQSEVKPIALSMIHPMKDEAMDRNNVEFSYVCCVDVTSYCK